MNKRWMIPLLVLSAAAAFSLGRFSRPASSGFDPARDLSPAHLVAQLGLSSAQAAELDQLHATYVQQVKAACDAHCAARCQLSMALGRDDVTEAQARHLVEKMCGSQNENEMATLNHILKMRQVLTPEQRAKFADTLGACLCATCPADGEACCATPTHTNDTEKTP